MKRGTNRKTGEKVAIKIMQKGKMTEEDRIGLLNEIDILKQVDHPNIVKLIDVYEDSQAFSLVLELMTGGEVRKIQSLFTLILAVRDNPEEVDLL